MLVFNGKTVKCCVTSALEHVQNMSNSACLQRYLTLVYVPLVARRETNKTILHGILTSNILLTGNILHALLG